MVLGGSEIGVLCVLRGLLPTEGLSKGIFGALKTCSKKGQTTRPVGCYVVCAHAPWLPIVPWAWNDLGSLRMAPVSWP